MLHTPLHRLLGEPPGSLTEAMIDAAVSQGLRESDELDWKASLPAQKEFRSSDIVKDIAAMANSGGGMIVFGVEESERAAIARTDAGELTENHERTIQQICFSAIQPPVFGVQAHQIASSANSHRAVALLIPASVDGPHLVYKGECFGAPLRTNADTQWMNERLIEASYRMRFEAARRSREELEALYADMAISMEPGRQAVLVGAARPRVPVPAPKRRKSRDVVPILDEASLVSKWWLGYDYHPLEDVTPYGAHPALRGWIIPPTETTQWRRARAAVFDDGAVGLVWKAGGHTHGPQGDELEPWQVRADAVESFVAALLALVHTVAADDPAGDIEILIGIEWSPSSPTPGISDRLQFKQSDKQGYSPVFKMPLGAKFRPIHSSIDPSGDSQTFIRTAIDIATDCLNQIGFDRPTRLDPMLLPRR